MSRPVPVPGPKLLVPGRRCAGYGCKINHDARQDPAGARRVAWGAHDVQCQVINPAPGPGPDGYPVCSLVSGHAGDCDYSRGILKELAAGRAAPGKPVTLAAAA